MLVPDLFPSFSEAAIAFRVSREAVRKWDRSGVPAERVLFVCSVIGWRKTPHQLRPDLYPNPTDAMPADAEQAVEA